MLLHNGAVPCGGRERARILFELFKSPPQMAVYRPKTFWPFPIGRSTPVLREKPPRITDNSGLS